MLALLTRPETLHRLPRLFIGVLLLVMQGTFMQPELMLLRMAFWDKGLKEKTRSTPLTVRELDVPDCSSIDADVSIERQCGVGWWDSNSWLGHTLGSEHISATGSGKENAGTELFFVASSPTHVKQDDEGWGMWLVVSGEGKSWEARRGWASGLALCAWSPCALRTTRWRFKAGDTQWMGVCGQL